MEIQIAFLWLFGMPCLVAAACSNYEATVPGDTDSGISSSQPDCRDRCPLNSCGILRLECGITDCGQCVNVAHQCVNNACKCVPKTCSEVSAQCGVAPDGCGGELFCGGCENVDAGVMVVGDAGAKEGGAGSRDGGTSVLACGMGNQCTTAPCVPQKASDACFSPTARLCGKHSDGCGGVVDCGSSACSGIGETCGGTGKEGICGCTPQASCSGQCFTLAPDGCGGMKRTNCNNCR